MALVAVFPSLARAAAPVAGFLPGEGWSYTFSVGSVPAGRARMSVGAPSRDAHGQRLVAVQGEAQSAKWLAPLMPLNDTYQVVIDADTLRTRTVSTVEHGVRERRADVKVEGPRFLVELRNDDEKNPARRAMRGLVDGHAVDSVAALFMLRASPLRDGEALTVLIVDGLSLYRTTAKVKGRERIELSPSAALTAAPSPAGTAGSGARLPAGKGHDEGATDAPAIRVEIEAVHADAWGRRLPPRHLVLWLSDDARRIPYRMEADTDIGRCSLDLAGFRPPSATGNSATVIRAPAATTPPHPGAIAPAKLPGHGPPPSR